MGGGVKFMSLFAIIIQIIHTKRVNKGLWQPYVYLRLTKNGILCPFSGEIDSEDLLILEKVA